MSLVRLLPFALAAGCLGGSPTMKGLTPGDSDPTRTPVSASALLPEGTAPSPPGSPDLGTTPAPRDLGGLTDCFGVAVCDPTMQFCIKFFTGSQSAPGALSNAPACFVPSDTCSDQGQPMDCNCIQNDPQLGLSCQGSCVDNGDGTYACYAQ
jgi:hypothetical protein